MVSDTMPMAPTKPDPAPLKMMRPTSLPGNNGMKAIKEIRYEFYILAGSDIQYINCINSAGIQKQLQTIRLHSDSHNGDRRSGTWLSVDDITDVMKRQND